MIGPVDEVGRGGVADDGGGVPGPGPDEVEGAVGTALEEGIAHEFIGLSLVEDGAVLVGDGPVVAVEADGVVDALLAVTFETGEEPRGVGCLLGEDRHSQREKERKSGKLQHAGIVGSGKKKAKCASLMACALRETRT